MDEVQVVPLAAYEAQAERVVRTVKYMGAGWVVSVLALIMVILAMVAYSAEEAVEEIQTITQDGGLYAYAGGDFNDRANNYNGSSDNKND